MKIKLITYLATGCILLGSASAQADTIELALVLDSSGSISPSDYALQVNAYNNIFNNNFADNILVGGDTLWVSAYQFATTAIQRISWTSITDNASASAFGNQFTLANFADNQGTLTNTEAATYLATSGLTGNGVDGDKSIIDISTDGVPTTDNTPFSTPTQSAITAATTANGLGITVNAVGVGSVDTTFLDDYTTAGGGFYTTANTFADFQTTLEDKLFREINEVPEPTTMTLLGVGLAGLVGLSRRKKK